RGTRLPSNSMAAHRPAWRASRSTMYRLQARRHGSHCPTMAARIACESAWAEAQSVARRCSRMREVRHLRLPGPGGDALAQQRERRARVVGIAEQREIGSADHLVPDQRVEVDDLAP